MDGQNTNITVEELDVYFNNVVKKMDWNHWYVVKNERTALLMITLIYNRTMPYLEFNEDMSKIRKAKECKELLFNNLI